MKNTALTICKIFFCLNFFWQNNTYAIAIESTNNDNLNLKKLTPSLDVQDETVKKPDAKNSYSDNTLNKADTTDKDIVDKYPVVGRIEIAIFGQAKPKTDIQTRLSDLEKATFKETYPAESLYTRTEKLKKTIFGSESVTNIEDLNIDESALINKHELSFLDEIIQNPLNQGPVKNPEELTAYANELINQSRSFLGLTNLTDNKTANILAKEQIDFLTHKLLDTKNYSANPDIRYTNRDGQDMISENTTVIKTDQKYLTQASKASIATLIKNLLKTEDSREALLSEDATSYGFAYDWNKSKTKLIATLEIISTHGIMHNIPKEITVGEKITVQGIVLKPYKFERMTLAWEANSNSTNNQDSSNNSNNKVLTPTDDVNIQTYFPPLDYVGYANKAQSHHEVAVNTLKTLGIIAAVAGGMFIPPVALVAPLIALSGSSTASEPKPQSEIPIHGGIKTAGQTFSGKIPISNHGKEGIYYLTIWARLENSPKLVSISRRTIIAKLPIQDEVKGVVEKANN